MCHRQHQRRPGGSRAATDATQLCHDPFHYEMGPPDWSQVKITDQARGSQH